MAAIIGGIAKAIGAGKVVGRIAGKIGGAVGRAVGRNRKVIGAVGTVIGGGAAAGAGAEAISRIGGGGSTEIGGLPLIVGAEEVQVLRAPPGYVLITDPGSGEQVAMLKEVAYALKLRKRPTRGGGITAREIRAARRVQSVISSLTVNRQPKFKLKRGRRR